VGVGGPPVLELAERGVAAGGAALTAALTNLRGCLLLRCMLPAQASVDDAMRSLVEVRDVVDRCPQLPAVLPRPA